MNRFSTANMFFKIKLSYISIISVTLQQFIALLKCDRIKSFTNAHFNIFPQLHLLGRKLSPL